MHVKVKVYLTTGHIKAEIGQAAAIIPSNKRIASLLSTMAEEHLSVKENMERLTLKGRDNFLDNYLKPALVDGWIEPLYPNSPRHPQQKYKVTIKGMLFVQSIKKTIMYSYYVS